ncbi:MAG: hypothetical protein WBS18_08935 [Candidatus Acidiferrales bacterium]
MAENRPATVMPNNATEPFDAKRRTQRVRISMPVVVRGKLGSGQEFDETTTTVTVNAHGCLVLLDAAVQRAQQVSLVNPKTAEELPCHVSFLGQKEGGKVQVGLEFGERSPLFWRITFPPEDWDSSQRKRPAAHARLAEKK